MLIKFTQISQCNKFAMQAILYQFKRDVAAWKDYDDAPNKCGEPGGK